MPHTHASAVQGPAPAAPSPQTALNALPEAEPHCAAQAAPETLSSLLGSLLANAAAWEARDADTLQSLCQLAESGLVRCAQGYELPCFTVVPDAVQLWQSAARKQPQRQMSPAGLHRVQGMGSLLDVHT